MIEGLDVSHYQDGVDWLRVAKSGRRFAIVKATEGQVVDPTFHANWVGMEAVGLLRGAYHFAHPGRSAVNQAVSFANTVHPRPTDLMVCDFETTDNQTPAACQAWLETFLTTVERLVGFKPVLYTSPLWFNGAVTDAAHFRDWPLWVADYRPVPRLPRGFTTWALHQYADDGVVPGVKKPCDVDRFNGDEAALRAFFHQSVTPPGPHPTETHHIEGGRSVARIEFPFTLDDQGRGSVGPPEGLDVDYGKVLAVSCHGEHDPQSGDNEYLVVPMGHHNFGGKLRVVATGGPPKGNVVALVCAAD